jgi:hypothetical protein
MTSRLAVILAGLVGIALLGMGVIRVRTAAAHALATDRALMLASSNARRVIQLAAAGERVADGQRPTHDVIARVNEALAEAGVSARALTDLRAEGDRTVDAGPPELRRQTVAATLEPLTLGELGRFLVEWRATQPLWTVTRIDISHKGRDDEATLSCRLVFAATYVAGP